MRLDILKNNPEYHGALVSAGTSTVMVGYAQARIGLRSEGLRAVDKGIAFYQTALEHSADVLAKRYLAVSRMKRGDILLMNGEDVAALREYQQAESALKPLADADPENDLIQADRLRVEYLKARVLIAEHKYAQALPMLKSQATAYDARKRKGGLTPDTSRTGGELFISLGEAYAGSGNPAAALQSFQKASSILNAGASDGQDDDINCDRATAVLKAGDALMVMGRPGEAETTYQAALKMASPFAIPGNNDVPALYPVANASLGSGDAYRALARISRSDSAQLTMAACAAYRKSKDAWDRVPNPAAIDPDGFLSRLPNELDSRLSRCKVEIAPLPK